MALSLRTSMALDYVPVSHSERLFVNRLSPAIRFAPPPHPPQRSVLAFSRRTNNSAFTSPSSSPKKKKVGFQYRQQNLPAKKKEEDVDDDDAFEALFGMLEEDLRNDVVTVGDDDEDVSEEDFEKLQRELEEAFGDVDDEGILNSGSGDIGGEENVDVVEEEEEEEPVKVKNWQLRRLARALKTGRRNTSVNLCLI